MLNIFLKEKLQKDTNSYKNIADEKNRIENNIDTLIKSDDKLIAKYIGNMIGGNFFTDDITPQILQLKTLFDQYNTIINTGSDQIVQNKVEIEKKTQSIIESLDQINKEMEKKIQDKQIEIEKVIGPQTIIQDLDYLLLDLQKDGTTEGIYKRLIS